MRSLVQVAHTEVETYDRNLKILPVSVICRPRIRREVTELNGKSTTGEATVGKVEVLGLENLRWGCTDNNLHLEASVVNPMEAKAYYKVENTNETSN